MAIAFDSSSNYGTWASGATITKKHTTSGADRVLIVYVLSNATSGSDRCTGVTYGGVAMTLLTKNTFGSGESNTVYEFGLVAPALGENDIVASFSPNVVNGNIGAISLTGAKQTGLPDAFATGNRVDQTLTLALTTVADNCWLVGACANRQGNTVSAGTGTTLRSFDNTNTFSGMFDSNGAKTPAGSHSLIVSRASGTQTFSGVIVSVAPSEVTPTPTTRRRRRTSHAQGNPMIY
jgi:hypothetical protein